MRFTTVGAREPACDGARPTTVGVREPPRDGPLKPICASTFLIPEATREPARDGAWPVTEGSPTDDKLWWGAPLSEA